MFFKTDPIDQVVNFLGQKGIWSLGTTGGFFVQRKGGEFLLRDEDVVRWLKRVTAGSQRIIYDIVALGEKLQIPEDELKADALRLGVALIRQDVFEFCCNTWSNPELALNMSEFVANVTLYAHTVADSDLYKRSSTASDTLFQEVSKLPPQSQPEFLVDQLMRTAKRHRIEVPAGVRNTMVTIVTSVQNAHFEALSHSVDDSKELKDANLIPIFEQALN